MLLKIQKKFRNSQHQPKFAGSKKAGLILAWALHSYFESHKLNQNSNCDLTLAWITDCELKVKLKPKLPAKYPV